MCGIFGISGHKEAARLTNLGLYALQHRGEESAGIVAFNGKRLVYHKGMGLVGDVFDEASIKGLRGSIAIGHVRYSTTGLSHARNIQPFFATRSRGHIAICHNGNLTNSFALTNELEKTGSLMQTSMDSEVIVHLIAKSKQNDVKGKVIEALARLDGAYSLALMVDGILIGARDPRGWRPLCLGKLGNAYVIASETCALDLINASYVRDIEPGEIVFIRDNLIESIKPFEKRKHAFCIFEFIYFARPDSNIFGKNVYQTRKRLGAELAKESPAKCDFVMPVPDSGNYAAVGYANRSRKPFGIGMIRNHYVGRTFIQPSQLIRDFRVRVKLNPIKDVLRGKTIATIDDSIVRGTTSKNRTRALRNAGAKKIHMRITCPPIKYPCFYGIDFPSKKELIASSLSVYQIARFIGVNSLKYLSIRGLLKAMLLPENKFCTACFTGKYPSPVPRGLSKKILEKGK